MNRDSRRPLLSPEGGGVSHGIGSAGPVFKPGVGMVSPGGSPPPAASAGGAAPTAESTEKAKIQAFKQGLGQGHHEDQWLRPTNKTGMGATHVRSFHCKLVADSLENLDKQINEWLDTHPDYEIKFVNTTIGEWTGKLKEPHLILQLWV